MCSSGPFSPAALLWRVWIIAISYPLRVTLEFRLMFWDLNGATTSPLLWSILHIAATVMDLPASEVAPRTMMARPSLWNLPFASVRIPSILGSLGSVMPAFFISDMTCLPTSGRWMKRQYVQSHRSEPLLDLRIWPRSSSMQG